MASFSLHAICKSFGSTRALAEIDLTLPDASRTVVIEAVAPAKAHCFASSPVSNQPMQVTFVCNEHSITNTAAHRRGVALLSQDYAVYPHLSAEKNLAAALEPLRLSSNEQQDRIESALQWFDLVELRSRRPAQLSGGQLQRVALAKAIVRRPQLLLLDEPLSQLDVTLREQSRELILKITKQFGSSLLMVTHDPLDALRLAEHVVVLENGRIAQRAAPQQVYQSPSSRYVADLLSPFGVNDWTVPASHPSRGGQRLLFRPKQLASCRSNLIQQTCPQKHQ